MDGLSLLAFHLHVHFKYMLQMGLFLDIVPYSPQLQLHANDGISGCIVPHHWSHPWGMFSIEFLKFSLHMGRFGQLRSHHNWVTQRDRLRHGLFYQKREVFRFYNSGNGRFSFSLPKFAERKPRGCCPKYQRWLGKWQSLTLLRPFCLPEGWLMAFWGEHGKSKSPVTP